MAKNNQYSFEGAIKAYLDKRAAEDELFAKKYNDPNNGKTIDDCCSYIKDQARKKAVGNCAAIADEEVYGWAVHYYDENIKPRKKADKDTVTVQHSAPTMEVTTFELTEEQKQAIQQKAEADYYAECKAKEQEKAKAKAKAEAERKKAQATAKREKEAKTMQMLFNFD